MDDHLPLTSKRSTAQADIRNYFHPSPNISPPALTTSSTHPVAQVRAKSDAAHSAIFEEWQAPVYKPRMPRSKLDGKLIHKTPQSPQYGHTRGQTVDRAQSQTISKRSRSGSPSGHRHLQTEDDTRIPKVSRRSPTSDVIDHGLVPKPLKLASHHSPSPSGDKTDTSDFFMESRVTPNHEKQCSDIDPSSTGLLSDGSDVLKGRRRITMKPILPRPDSQSSRLTWDDAAVMYLQPSPTLTSSVPSVPEKARRTLGTNGERSNILSLQPAAQPDCEIYAGPADAIKYQTSRHRVETAQEIRLANEKSDKTSKIASKKKGKGGRLAKLIFGGAVDDRVA